VSVGLWELLFYPRGPLAFDDLSVYSGWLPSLVYGVIPVDDMWHYSPLSGIFFLIGAIGGSCRKSRKSNRSERSFSHYFQSITPDVTLIKSSILRMRSCGPTPGSRPIDPGHLGLRTHQTAVSQDETEPRPGVYSDIQSVANY
jgi:hypothetical protein